MSKENKQTVIEEGVNVRGISIERTIRFLRARWLFMAASLIIIVLGVVLFFTKKGFKLGIDFSGGARVDVAIRNPDANINAIRSLFSDAELESEVITVGDPASNNYLITVSGHKTALKTKATVDTNTVMSEENESDKIRIMLENKFGSNNVEIRGASTIGPKMGQTFAQRATQLVLIVAAMILIYVALRFDFYYGAGAILALFHDILIMLAFALFLDIRITVPVIAALLTILGYSINDTIVVFDRVREYHKLNPDEDYEHVMDRSITQSMSRTIITSLTTLFVAIAIAIWGGVVLHDFGILMVVGIVSGTYSSIFIASPITFMLKKALDKNVRSTGHEK